MRAARHGDSFVYSSLIQMASAVSVTSSFGWVSAVGQQPEHRFRNLGARPQRW